MVTGECVREVTSSQVEKKGGFILSFSFCLFFRERESE